MSAQERTGLTRLGGITLVAGLLLICFELLLGELLAPRTAAAAGGARAQAISKLANVSFGSGTGAWVRDGDLILNVAGQNSERPFGSMQLLKDRVVAGPA